MLHQSHTYFHSFLQYDDCAGKMAKERQRDLGENNGEVEEGHRQREEDERKPTKRGEEKGTLKGYQGTQKRRGN